jgi:integrase/recombinase XerD
MHKSDKPLKKHLSDYLDWLDVEKGLVSNSQKNYSRFLNRFLEWLELKKLSNLKPHELTAEHVWDYRIYLARQTTSKNSKETLSKTTQKLYLIALRSFITYFASRDILALPPEKIKLPKDKSDREVQFLNLEELRRLFDVPDLEKRDGLRNRAILETLFSTGMRISELVKLDKDQIASFLDKEYLELGIIGKGGRARTVYFSARTLKWIKKYLKTRDDNLKPLFINYRSRKDATRRLTVRSVENFVKKYALRAGLPSNVTPHVLRHSFATNLLNQGVDLRIVQEFLGHKSITATQIYTHITNKKLADVHKKFHGMDES